MRTCHWGFPIQLSFSANVLVGYIYKSDLPFSDNGKILISDFGTETKITNRHGFTKSNITNFDEHWIGFLAYFGVFSFAELYNQCTLSWGFDLISVYHKDNEHDTAGLYRYGYGTRRHA